MAFDGTDPCWEPDIPTLGVDLEWRLRIARFGDDGSYQQRTMDGINALKRSYTITLTNRPDGVINAINAYLEAEQGTAFPFRDPVSGITYNVFCDEWSVEWPIYRKHYPIPGAYFGTLTATFTVAYGATAAGWVQPLAQPFLSFLPVSELHLGGVRFDITTKIDENLTGVAIYKVPAGGTLDKLAHERKLVAALPNTTFRTAYGPVIPNALVNGEFLATAPPPTTELGWGVSTDTKTLVHQQVGNKVATSDDGMTWVSRVSPYGSDVAGATGLYNVTFGGPAPGMFVAVGLNGAILRSTDGVVWMPTSGGGDLNYYSVRWAGPPTNLFVAVAANRADATSSPRLATSPDGITWTTRTSTLDGRAWLAVAVNDLNTRLVAVSNTTSTTRAAWSNDGITWVTNSAIPQNRWQNIAYGGPGENDAFTKILLHMDGANASTVFTDVAAGGAAHTWTAGGAAQISTAQSVFGGASALFDGSADWITTPDHTDFALGANDWTIDFRFRFAGGDGTTQYLASHCDTSATVAASSFYLRKRSTNDLHLYVSNGTVATSLISTKTFTTAINPGWHHVAAVRSGTTLSLYVDGVLEASGTLTGSVPDSANVFCVGGLNGVSSLLNGNIDEFRLSVGIARWTAAFTPPAAVYGNAKVFVAVGSTGTGNRIVWTADGGLTWTVATGASDYSWYGVCWSEERQLFVAVALSGTGRCATSPDGKVWTMRTLNTNANWESVTWNAADGLFCAVASTSVAGTNRGATSPDGITWTMRNISNEGNAWKGVTAGLGRFVTVASTDAALTENAYWTGMSALAGEVWRGGYKVENVLGSMAITFGDNAVYFSDNFNRANANLEASPVATLGGSWVHDGVVAAAAVIDTNAVRSNTGSSTGSAYKSPPVGSLNHYCQFTVVDITSPLGSFVACRLIDNSNFMGVRNGPTEIQVYSRIAGTFTFLLGVTGINIGDVVRLECIDSLWKLYKNNNQIGLGTIPPELLNAPGTGIVMRSSAVLKYDDVVFGRTAELINTVNGAAELTWRRTMVVPANKFNVSQLTADSATVNYMAAFKETADSVTQGLWDFYAFPVNGQGVESEGAESIALNVRVL